MPRLLSLLTLALVAGAGCIVTNTPPPPPPDPFGDLSFDWSFAGEPSCDDAGVDEVDLALLQNGEVVLVIEREPCVGGGLTITDLREGVYEVAIDAFARDSVPLYAGSFPARVIGGEDTYAGVVELDLVNAPPPPPPTGDLGLFWSFLYPTDGNAVTDCVLAGAEEIDVFVRPQGSAGAIFDSTFFCDDEGVLVENLPVGRYTIELVAFGRYHGADVPLYESGDIVVDVLANGLVDLGDVSLPRVDPSFSDFDVAWTFSSASCASTGVQSVQLSFARFGFTTPEDVFQVDCTATNVIRRTFVPGSYTVTARAQGTSDDFLATVTVDLAPDSVAQIDLVLAP